MDEDAEKKNNRENELNKNNLNLFFFLEKYTTFSTPLNMITFYIVLYIYILSIRLRDQDKNMTILDAISFEMQFTLELYGFKVNTYVL